MLPLLGLVTFLATLWWVWSKWSDMPVRFDRPMWCDECRATTTHTVTAYKDEEIRTCSRCHTRTIYEVVEGELEETESSKPDASKEDYDFKRRDPRRYRPRKKPGEEDEESE
jgi:hypothetical protein